MGDTQTTRDASSVASLDGVRARLERSKHHIQVLVNAQREIEGFKPGEIKIIPNRQPPEIHEDGRVAVYSDVIDLGEPISDDQWAIRLGEAVYNIRACLDYLVYELALLDSGTEQNGTQFLIESKPKNFESKKGSYLWGLSAEHFSKIEDLQPFNGGSLLAQLADLSNPDKHRRLTTINTNNQATITGKTQAIAPDGQLITLQFDPKRVIALSDGRLVVPLLTEILSHANSIVEMFESDFDG